MRWIVGVDLLELSRGAIRFAAWVRHHQPAEELIGVHCLGEHRPGPGQSEEEFHAGIRGLAERAIAEVGARAAFGSVAVVDADSPEEGLAQAVQREEADVLVVGRKARRGTDPLVSLGRAARRLLRTVALPIAVVPPDLEALPAGPVVVATDLKESSRSALSFARALARKLGRELRVVHVVSSDEAMRVAMATDAWEAGRREAVAEGRAALSANLAAQGIEAPGEVVSGAVAFALLDVCAREEACVLVCGSRRLSRLEKLFSASVGSELAALAAFPVIVVPPAASA